MMIVMESYRYKKEGKLVIVKTEEDLKSLQEVGKIMGTIRDEMVKRHSLVLQQKN